MNIQMKFLQIAAILLVAGAAISTAHATTREVKSLGTFGSWKVNMIVYTVEGRLPKEFKRTYKGCSARATLIRREPVLKNDDSALTLGYVGGLPIVIHASEVNKKPTKALKMTVGGRNFDLGEGQLLKHKHYIRITAAMRRAKTAEITSLLPDGSKVVHVYSLAGFNNALDAIKKACGTR